MKVNKGIHTKQQAAGKSTFFSRSAPFFAPSKKTATPTVQKSAVAHFEDAGFEERAQVVREDFEDTLPYDTFLVRLFGIRKRRQKKFEERIELLNPEKYAALQQELTKEFGHKPKKLARKLKKLEKRKQKAANKIGPLPAFGRILVIEVTYHYVESQQMPDGTVYSFPNSALEAVKQKFKVGSIWQDLDWKGEKIGVRFDIRFKKHATAAEVQQITGGNPGHARMEGRQLLNQSPRAVYDYTQEPPIEPPASSGGEVLGEANAIGMGIDTEAVKNEEHNVTYYKRASDMAEGRPPTVDSIRPKGATLDNYLASLIAHEIGHNIGMVHGDKGIMKDQVSRFKRTAQPYTEQTSSGVKNDTRYSQKVIFPDNPVNEENIQRLLDRIPGMSTHEHQYWSEELKSGAVTNTNLKDSGYTVLKPTGTSK